MADEGKIDPLTDTDKHKLKEMLKKANAITEVPQPDQASVPPTTTKQEDITKASQIEVNLIWETTQMKVALSVIWSSLLVAAVLAVFGKLLGSEDLQLAAVVFVFGVANLVTGFYFGRTNHTKTGGVDEKPEERRGE